MAKQAIFRPRTYPDTDGIVYAAEWGGGVSAYRMEDTEIVDGVLYVKAEAEPVRHCVELP